MQRSNIALAQRDAEGLVKKGRWADHRPIDPRDFPDRERRSGFAPCTQPNVRFLLSENDISVGYDVIEKRFIINPLGWVKKLDNDKACQIALIVSLAESSNLQRNGLEEQIYAIAGEHQFNPVKDWIESKPWDGEDRLPALYATLSTDEGFDLSLKHKLMDRWFISCVAAALSEGDFKGRGVLTLVGPQGIGKTGWVCSLVDDVELSKKVIKADHFLDPHNRDSVLDATSNWIVELGEIESCFRKDMARLKGFLTRSSDTVRRPYGKDSVTYARRTVFAATVNDPQFLVDDTGNTRFFTLPVHAIDYKHNLDMQQVFAQYWVRFQQGERWWLDRDEESALEEHNQSHRSASALRDQLLCLIDIEREGQFEMEQVGTTDIFQRMGIANPKNAQAKELTGILRELIGPSKKSRGTQKWEVPFRVAKPAQWQDMFKQKNA